MALLTVGVASVFAQSEVPSVVAQDDSFPTLGTKFLDPSDHPITFGSAGFFDVFTELSLDISSSSRFGRPAINTSIDRAFDGTMRMKISSGGSSLVHVRPMTGTMRMQHTATALGLETDDTEMLEISVSGGDLPAGMMVRESPTLQSKGKAYVRESPSKPSRISSFFDVFLELSLDNGAT